jgi:hypothetical protein
MNRRIFQLSGALVLAAICGSALFCFSEVVSVKLHPEGLTDRVINSARAIAWEPRLGLVVLPLLLGFVWAIVVLARFCFRSNSVTQASEAVDGSDRVE